MNPRVNLRPSVFSQLAFVSLWVFVFSMPSEKLIDIPGFGTLGRAVGILAMVTGALAILFERRIRIPTATHVLMMLFVLWAAFSYRWSLAPDNTQERLVTNVQLLAVPLLIWNLCSMERRCLALLDAYVVGTLVATIQTLQRFLSGTQTYYQRYAAQGFEPNDLALTLALSLPISYYLSLRRGSKWRWAYAIHILLVCGTIFLTASRGGTLAMAVGLSLILWTLPALRWQQRIAVITAGAAAAAAAFVLVPATSWNRLFTLGSEVTQGTLNNRSLLWGAGWSVFRDAPIAGIGAGSYPAALVPSFGEPWGWVPVAHNSFLSVLVETGVVGFVIFAGMLLVLAALAARLAWMDSAFWLTTLAVWTTGVSALTWEYRKPTWFIFGILVAHVALRLRERATWVASSKGSSEEPDYESQPPN